MAHPRRHRKDPVLTAQERSKKLERWLFLRREESLKATDAAKIVGVSYRNLRRWQKYGVEKCPRKQEVIR